MADKDDEIAEMRRQIEQLQLATQASATRNAELEILSQASNTRTTVFEAKARAFRIRNVELEDELEAIPKSAA